jgi:hypothetical protein
MAAAKDGQDERFNRYHHTPNAGAMQDYRPHPACAKAREKRPTCCRALPSGQSVADPPTSIARMGKFVSNPLIAKGMFSDLTL